MEQLPTIMSDVPGEKPVEFETVMKLSYDIHSELLDILHASFAASGIQNSGAKFLIFLWSLSGAIQAFDDANPGLNLRKAIAKDKWAPITN